MIAESVELGFCTNEILNKPPGDIVLYKVIEMRKVTTAHWRKVSFVILSDTKCETFLLLASFMEKSVDEHWRRGSRSAANQTLLKIAAFQKSLKTERRGFCSREHEIKK